MILKEVMAVFPQNTIFFETPCTTYGGRWIVVESRDLFLYRENLSFCLESKIELNQQKREHETQQTENLINHLKW